MCDVYGNSGRWRRHSERPSKTIDRDGGEGGLKKAERLVGKVQYIEGGVLNMQCARISTMGILNEKNFPFFPFLAH